eukprot:CAMPEP_0119107340 /NCGR_PEP_ID=MMETSP1180-20130426/9649_1 /TAXON_ID=3052 ORGANISM="Chlamydomonas cf sp, Strain CCMP681" /NCGR_SAMPLE_ID=MMETSP1180 /ASSEMBLY_ACC=CAM_ASM_000741 /LENGTH=201 /DNA_ID=CAMNT_0007092813 /DNA_START=79 /DNA_END=684 /DNA_ORIENTATION=+
MTGPSSETRTGTSTEVLTRMISLAAPLAAGGLRDTVVGIGSHVWAWPLAGVLVRPLVSRVMPGPGASQQQRAACHFESKGSLDSLATPHAPRGSSPAMPVNDLKQLSSKIAQQALHRQQNRLQRLRNQQQRVCATMARGKARFTLAAKCAPVHVASPKLSIKAASQQAEQQQQFEWLSTASKWAGLPGGLPGGLGFQASLL